MILHIVSTSPFASKTLTQCINRMAKQDGLLFIQDGVYALTDRSLHTQLATVDKLYALEDDIQARGLTNSIHSAQIIDYEAFVALTLAFNSTLSW
ncbi:MAG: tRNA 2-thiouridine synthesizing protein B [Paraglaciecola sp.]|jgi:tRNA 2-thiouridine synthesizing protein B